MKGWLWRVPVVITLFMLPGWEGMAGNNQPDRWHVLKRTLQDTFYWNHVHRDRFYLTLYYESFVSKQGIVLSSLIDSILHAYGLTPVDSVIMPELNLVVIELQSAYPLHPETIIRVCKKFYALRDHFFTFEPVPKVLKPLCPIPADFQTAPPQNTWTHTLSRVDSAWCFTTGGNEWIAVLDDAIDWFHEDLSEYSVAGYDYADNDSDPTPPAPNSHTHGTAVSSIAIASIYNNTGIWGVVNDSLYFAKIATDAGVFGGSPTVQAFYDILQMDHIKVINMSWGSYGYNATEHQILRALYDSGKVLISAMGNSGIDQPFYHAALPEVIGVGSASFFETTADYPQAGVFKAGFSNYGDHLEILAPGGVYKDLQGNNHLVRVAQPQNSYAWSSGTSLSAPFVAGVAALVFSVNPCIDGKIVRKIIQETALDLYPPGKDTLHGYGLIMADRAVKAALPIYLTRASITVIPTACGYCTGALILVPDSLYNGLHPLYISWNDSFSDTLFSETEFHVRYGLCEGFYSIHAYDSTGCGDTLEIHIPCSTDFLSASSVLTSSLSVRKAGNVVYVEVPSESFLPLLVVIYSLEGKIIKQHRILFPGIVPIAVDLPSGVYYMALYTTNRDAVSLFPLKID